MNNDLISREALLEAIRTDVAPFTLSMVFRNIHSAPAVDAVEVVRCKDCRYCYYDQIYFHYWCERKTGKFLVEEDGLRSVAADSFCSYGERREDHETD